MKKNICIFFVLAHLFLGGQNLVPNGDFENYSSCPTVSSQLPLAAPWTAAPNNSVEYFNACNMSYLNVPQQNANYQQAHSGQAFAGCYFMNGFNSYREYPQILLTSTLINNNYYNVYFYVNRKSGTYYAVNNIAGAFHSTFTTTNTSTTFSNVLSYSVDVQKFGNPIIKDTLDWVKIETIYKSNGTENYFLIGNFKYDNQTDTINMNDGSYGGAYYFIDDVSVINIATPQWQYRDTTIILGDSVLIGPAITGLNVNWYDMSSTFIKNAPGIYVKPTLTTSYQATETFNSVVYNHTVTVTVLPTKVNEYDKTQNSVKLFPNPNTGFVNVKCDNFKNGETEIIVTDVNSQIVYQNKHQIINTLIQFNIDVKNGFYLVKIINSQTNEKITKKIIIQK